MKLASDKYFKIEVIDQKNELHVPRKIWEKKQQDGDLKIDNVEIVFTNT
jgi:hypothetical protein